MFIYTNFLFINCIKMSEAMKKNPENNVDVKNLLPNGKMAFNETEKTIVKNSVNNVMTKLEKVVKEKKEKVSAQKEREEIMKITKEELGKLETIIKTREQVNALKSEILNAIKNKKGINDEKKHVILDVVKKLLTAGS